MLGIIHIHKETLIKHRNWIWFTSKGRYKQATEIINWYCINSLIYGVNVANVEMPVRCLKITIWTWNQKESLKKIFFKKHGWLSVVQLLKWRTSSLKRRSDNLSDSLSDFAVEERGSGFVSAMRTAGWTFASLQPKTQFLKIDVVQQKYIQHPSKVLTHFLIRGNGKLF